MNFNKQHFIYWVLPLVATIVMVLMNYSGILWMSDLIAPSFNREFGLLENLQLVVILCISVVIWKGFFRKKTLLEKIGYAGLFLISLVLFLEEIDYGIHYWEFFFNDGVENKQMIRNFHNQGNNLNYIKQITYVILITLFAILPLFSGKFKSKLINYIAPKKIIITSLVVYFLSGLLARHTHKVLDLTINEGLRGNHQEFEELIIYYLFFLYFFEIVFEKGALPLNFSLIKKTKK